MTDSELRLTLRRTPMRFRMAFFMAVRNEYFYRRLIEAYHISGNTYEARYAQPDHEPADAPLHSVRFEWIPKCRGEFEWKEKVGCYLLY